MSLGLTPPSPDLYRSTRQWCEPKLGATSIYRLLAEQGHGLFGDETFADLFDDVGRRSVPPRIVATVMVLQRLEGASDREAVDRFAFDLRWKYAAGVDLDFPVFMRDLMDYAAKHPQEAAIAVGTMMVARCLRRAADHAMNIADGARFAVRDEKMPR